MTDDPAPPSASTRHRLAVAPASARAEIVLRSVEDHPDGLLLVPRTDDGPAELDEVDLSRTALGRRVAEGGSPPSWWDAEHRTGRFRKADLRGARLRRADLRGIDLGGSDLSGVAAQGADLRRARLEEANLSGADLASARLTRAQLGKADLRGAMLEDADLAGASLRFADLREAVLEGANLRSADLWSADLREANVSGAKFRAANLREARMAGADLSRTDLRRAVLLKANLSGANLSGADLRGADLGGANLSGADLRDARLEGLDLSQSQLAGVLLAGAYLDRTRLRRDQLGDAIGEELAGRFELAGRAYQGLERNFAERGDADASSWAYRRRRRMQKRAAIEAARAAFRNRRWTAAFHEGARFACDQAVEWLCDYGESIPRVLATMAVVYLLFSVLYGITNSVVVVSQAADGSTVKQVTRNPLDLAVFSLLAMTTSGSPAVGLEPRTEAVHLLTGLQASLGIALTGLLGFVLGNRVRR